MRYISDKHCRERQYTYFVFSNVFSLENHAVYEIMWKNNVERGGQHMAIWRMLIACWILKATHTHTHTHTPHTHTHTHTHTTHTSHTHTTHTHTHTTHTQTHTHTHTHSANKGWEFDKVFAQPRWQHCTCSVEAQNWTQSFKFMYKLQYYRLSVSP